MLDVPVVLFVFNRPDTTLRVLGRIRAARPRQLRVIADGPRPDHPADTERCAAVRALIETGVDWPCDVRREYAEKNLGCGRRVASGLDWVFSESEDAIILEDDCVPEPLFFDFCAELLDRYRDENQVGVIAGSNFQPDDVTGGSGYYFSRYAHCWGWATWRRAWRHYDFNLSDWPAVRSSGWLQSRFESAREADYWERIFDRTHAGAIATWDYQWMYVNWRSDALTVVPAANLVTNIGFGDAATHTRNVRSQRKTGAQPQPWPLTHPARIERNAAADRYTYRHHYDPSLLQRAWRKLDRLRGEPEDQPASSR